MRKDHRKSGSENFRSAYRRGLRAAEQRMPRWVNPFEGIRARAWLYGWNIGHTQHGNCRGCELCGKNIGTKKPPAFAKFLEGFDGGQAQAAEQVI